VIIAEPELARGADHPVRYVAVCLAGGDRERSRQDRTGEGNHDVVANAEIGRATDDAASAAVPLADIDPAITDRLFQAGQLLDLPDEADDDRPGDVDADLVDCLDLQAGADEPLGDVAS
jgi:hypothetical protein